MGTIRWPNNKVGPKCGYFNRGPFGGPITKWAHNMAISRIRLYGRPFGGPVVKWGQNVAISTIREHK